jgi:acyl-homoserine lactone acylase PvdQ
MVARRFSADGDALAAMGPQVGYYSPQIFTEYELHGGGIDSEGVVFPGADPFPLIGHGVDFAWTGTSANGDNEDTFVERLCNPDGSPASFASTNYLYKGRCTPFLMRTQSLTTPLSALSPGTPPQTISYRTMRSVHGPVFEYATVRGAPVALTKAKAVDFHEVSAIIPFMELSENAATDVHSFVRIMGQFPGTENWFYVDRHDVGWIQSGVYPEHARHSDVELPWWGDGRADWVGFDPTTYAATYIPASHRPQAIDPPDGFIISWNNVEAPGWHAPPTSWDSGPIQHALILQRRLLAEVKRTGDRVTLGGVARVADLTATTDLRGEDLYPLMRAVVGRTSGVAEQVLEAMDAWHASGSQRLAPEGSNAYAHGEAIAAFDAWWPRAVTGEFQPVLGKQLMDTVEQDVLSLPQTGFNYEWTSQMYKDLRGVLHVPERGRYSHIYCGSTGAGTRQPARGLTGRALSRVRARCRAVLLGALNAAIAAVSAKQGPNPTAWQVPATCPQTDPPSCDQEVPTTAGAISTPPFPWQDRGTYHQVTEVAGHR